MKTVSEVSAALKQYDEVTVLELLGVSSEDLVDRFSDLVSERFSYLVKELEGIEDLVTEEINNLPKPDWELSWGSGDYYEEDE